MNNFVNNVFSLSHDWGLSTVVKFTSNILWKEGRKKKKIELVINKTKKKEGELITSIIIKTERSSVG